MTLSPLELEQVESAMDALGDVGDELEALRAVNADLVDALRVAEEVLAHSLTVAQERAFRAVRAAMARAGEL